MTKTPRPGHKAHRASPAANTNKPLSQGRRLSAIDAAFLYLERKEIPLHIAGVCVFESAIPYEEFVAAIDSKLHLLPRYRQVVVDPPFHFGYPTWEDDTDFDIREHIFRVRVKSPGGRAQFEELASGILTAVMDRRKPLWDIHIVEGLKDGRGAIIARVHHALADGIAGASLLKIMLDPTPSGSHAIRKPRFRPRPALASSHSVADALASAVHSSLDNMISVEEVILDFAQSLFQDRTQNALEKVVDLLPELAASTERFSFNKLCTGDRKFCWTQIPFEDVTAIRDAAGGTINDVILTIMTRAIALYIRMHGESTAGRFIRMVCPVNVRRQNDQGEALGNQISFLPVALPLGIDDPVRMLKAVATRTDIMKNARAAHLVALIASCLGSTPPPFQAMFWHTLPMVALPLPLLNIICTNVPGSPTPLYAVGRKMIASYPHVPTGYELGVNCAVQSYNGTLYWGLTADSQVVPDVGRLRDFIQAAYRELRRAAGVRKPPAKRKPAPAARKSVEVRPPAVAAAAATGA